MNFFILLCLALCYVAIQSAKLFMAIVYVQREATRVELQEFSLERHGPPDLTVMQPILSGDPQLLGLLRENLHRLPAATRFLWLIDEEDKLGLETAFRAVSDLAISHVGEVSPPTDSSEESPRVRALLFPAAPADVNPKVFKLKLAIRHVTTLFSAVLDDDTSIDAQSLEDAVGSLESVDLYTGLPTYRRGTTFWSDLVSHFVNNNAVLTYLPPLVLFPPLSLNGMFYVFRTELISSLGGFEMIETQLCDDYALHRLLLRQGKVVRQGISRQTLSTTVANHKAYFKLLHRWNLFAKLLIAEQAWFVRGFLLTTLAMPAVCLWSFLILACASYSTLTVWLLVLITLMIRQAIVSMSHKIAFGVYLSMNPFMSLLAELLQPFHALGACLSKSIDWRGRHIKVERNQAFYCSQRA